jgi:hypothetical protein
LQFGIVGLANTKVTKEGGEKRKTAKDAAV